MRSKLTSRALAALLAAVMVVGLLPMTALAARVDRDDAPVAEVAMGEEAVTAPVRVTSKAAEVAEAEEMAETVMVAKAELGTSATFGGDRVDLSNALYTFTANGSGYTVSATVPGTETAVYLNIAGGTNVIPNMSSANGTPVRLIEQSDSKWFELKDGSSLHFHTESTGNNVRVFNRCTNSCGVKHNFALFRLAGAGETSSEEIPGYVRITGTAQVNAGGAYLIAAKAEDNCWYVLYPADSTDKYAHVAKVALVEEAVETPDEPEPPVEKTRYYFESVNMEGGAWTISDGSVPNPNTVETQNGGNWVSATEIVGGADRNYRLWAPGPGYLNFDKVGDVLLTNKLKGGQNAASIQLEKQTSNVYLISYVKDGTTYYLTAENQTSNGQDRAVFSADKADAVPYFVEAESAGSNVYRIYCVGPYTVSFDGGYEGAEAIAPMEAMYGTALPTPAEREGYTFMGWFDGETKYTEATADVALTAKWKMDPGYTPAEAVEAGKIITYLAFTGGTSNSRWWDATDEAGDTTKIQLYAASGVDSGSTVTLNTDGITAGNYVINFDTGNSGRQAVMHYSDGVTNQCSAVSVVCGNNGPLHLFVLEKAEGNTAINAFTIKAYNTTKYLSLEASGNNRVFKDDKTVFYVTPAADPNDGTYYIWTAADPEPVVSGKEAPPAELETVLEYRLAEGALAEGVYAIVGSTTEAGKTPRSMHYWTDSRTILDQCTSEAAAGAETVSFSDVATNHLWNVTRTAEGKYTFAAVAAEGNYITGGAGTLSRGTTATEFTVVARSDGGHDLSWVDDGTTYYMAWDGTRASGSRWYGATDQYRINLYKEGNAPFAMAQTVFKGTSQNQPLVREDTNSQFRIPALYTLKNGWIVAACDIRWTTTADSPANLDTIVSISKDGGETWDWEVVNYFADFPSTVNSSASASFIDPAIVQTKDGSVWLLVDAQAPHVNGGKIGNGFDAEGRLRISKSPVNGDYSMDNAHDNNLHGYTFDYYVDINNAGAGADYTVDGKTVKLWPICANADDHETGYYVDAFFNTYYDHDEGGMKPVLALQRNSSKVIHNNIFYTESEWKVFPTAFIMARKATVNEEAGTLDWGEPHLISDQIKYNTEHFIGVCPGRGFVTEAGENGERIIFPIYDNLTGEKASSVYSDDGGVTWHRGERIPNGQANKTSESQIVELPVSENEADGTFLRIYCRNENATISYADSYDGGETWSAGVLDSALKYGTNTMVSFINLKGYLIGADDTIYSNLILASYPWGTKESGEHRRSNGVVRIGYYDPADGTGPVHWLNENEIRYPGRFNYSCVTQLLDGNNEPTDSFGLLYEKDATGGMEMLYYTLTSEDLLGEGWSLVQEVPALPAIESEIVLGEEVAPAIAAAKALDLDMGETGALTAAVTLTGEGADDGEEAAVVWTSSDESVATVSKSAAAQASLLSEEDVVTVPGEQVVINAVGAGRAYITATTTKNGITRKAVTEVVVQGEDDIIVPGHYLDEMVTADTAGTAAYTVSADGLEKLIEAGGDAVEEDYTETLELAATYTDKAKADEAQAQIAEVTKALYAKLTGRNYEAELPEPPEADVYTVDSIADRVYTGEALEPTVIARKNGAVLTTGYTLEYKNNVNVGEATVNVVVGGKVVATATFRIVEDTAAGGDTGNTGSNSNGGGSYSAPAEEELDDLDVPLAQLPMTFEDVKADDWFYEAAEFVFAQDMMQGVSATEFRPTMNTTRGMVVTILHRMAHEPEAEPATFADVASTAWYGPAVAWGAQSKVVQGAEDGDFHPMDAVTREQLAVFLYRFAEYSGYDVSARGELSGYADSGVVSSWAKEAMSWAVGTGLITGKDGNVLAPLSAASRAELAAILTRFCKTVAAEEK